MIRQLLMESLANRWKASLQSQSAQELKLSRLAGSRKEQLTKSKLKESVPMDPKQLSKHSKDKEEKAREEKNKYSRTKSSEQRKHSSTKQKQSIAARLQTPHKMVTKRNEKIAQRYTNAILQLLQEGQSNRLKGKIRGLLQDMSSHIQSDGLMASSMRIGVGDRAFHQLELKYFESEKDRQYLKGKMQINSKRYEGLQRELQRYSKIQKLIDSSISRENQLRQQVSRLKADRAFLQAQMQEQKEVFSRQVHLIRSLIQSLKVHLPTG